MALSMPAVFKASSAISGVAFNPDGQWLACGCATPHAFKMWYAGPAIERSQAVQRWHAAEAEGLMARKAYQAAQVHLDALPVLLREAKMLLTEEPKAKSLDRVNQIKDS